MLAGNAPAGCIASIAQGALVKAVNLFKMPSSDPFTTVRGTAHYGRSGRVASRRPLDDRGCAGKAATNRSSARLGIAELHALGSPHDAMYPLQRLVHWMADDDVTANES